MICINFPTKHEITIYTLFTSLMRMRCILLSYQTSVVRMAARDKIVSISKLTNIPEYFASSSSITNNKGNRQVVTRQRRAGCVKISTGIYKSLTILTKHIGADVLYCSLACRFIISSSVRFTAWSREIPSSVLYRFAEFVLTESE